MTTDRNPRVTDVVAAFDAIAQKGNLIKVTGGSPFPSAGHVQGIVRYRDYWISNRSAEESAFDHGWLFVLDAVNHKYVSQKETPHADGTPAKGRNHPSGMQICGDFLFVGVQQYNPPQAKADSVVLIYDLTQMSNGHLPDPYQPPTPFVVPTFNVGAVAITDVTTSLPEPVALAMKGHGPVGLGKRHLLCCHDDGKLKFYLSNGAELPGAAFTEMTLAAGIDQSDKSAEQIGLFCDTNNHVYLIYLCTQGPGWRDMALLYEVTLDVPTHTITAIRQVPTRDASGDDHTHLVTQHGAIKGTSGVHFRYGGGVRVVEGGALELLATQMDLYDEGALGAAILFNPLAALAKPAFAINVFAPK